MADVFISYSRRDKTFVGRLKDALAGEAREVWIDWEDIPLSADWWQEICAGIEGADAFVFVITPDSVSSPVCHLEIAHAQLNHKRLIPIMRTMCDEPTMLAALAERSLDANVRASLGERSLPDMARANWAALGRHNWLMFGDDQDFDARFADLLAAIETDLDHVRLHTRLLVRAREWETGNRRASVLLRGDDLGTAEDWLAAAAEKTPAPTLLQTEYITASRRAANRQQRIVIGGLTFGIVVALVLAILSAVLARQSEDQRLLAEANAETAVFAQAQAQDNAATATIALGEAEQRGTAVAQQALTATIALGVAEQRGTEAAAQALTAVFAQAQAQDNAATSEANLRSTWNTQALMLAEQSRNALADNQPQTALLLALRSLEHFPNGIYNGESHDALRAALHHPLREVLYGAHNDAVVSAVMNRDGTRLLSASSDGTARVWDTATGAAVLTLVHEQPLQGARWNGDETLILTWSAPQAACIIPNCLSETRLWDAQTGAPRLNFQRIDGHYTTSAGWSPDGVWLYAVQRDAGMLRWRMDALDAEPTAVVPDAIRVDEAQFSRDGRWLAVLGARPDADNPGDFVRFVEVIDAATWAVQQTWTELADENDSPATNRNLFVSFAWSPQPNRLYIMSEQNIVMYNVETGERGRLYESPEGVMRQFAVSPNGSLIAAAHSVYVSVWNTQSGAQWFQVLQPDSFTSVLAWRDDSEHLAIGGGSPGAGMGCDGTAAGCLVRVYSIADPSAPKVTFGLPGSVQGILWGGTGDANALLVGWSVDSVAVQPLAYVEDVGYLVAADDDPFSPGLREPIRAHLDGILAAAHLYSSPVRLVTASSDGVRVWAVEAPPPGEASVAPSGETGLVYTAFAARHDTAQVYVGSSQNTGALVPCAVDCARLAAWDAAAVMQRYEVIVPDTVYIDQIVLSPDETTLAVQTRDRDMFALYDAATGTLRQRLVPAGQRADRLAFNADGTRLATVSRRALDAGTEVDLCTPAQTVVEVWDTATGERLSQFEPEGKQTVYLFAWHDDAIILSLGDNIACDFRASSPNGTMLRYVAGADTATTLLTTHTLYRIEASQDAARVLLWDRDAGTPPSVYDLASRKRVEMQPQPDPRYAARTLEQVRLSADGGRVAAIDNSPEGCTENCGNLVWLWNAATGAPLAAIVNDAVVNDVRLSADGARVVVWDSSTVRVWDTEPLRVRFAYSAPGDFPIAQVVWSSDETQMLVVTADSQHRIIDTRSGEVLYTVQDNSSFQSQIVWNGGNALASFGEFATLWTLDVARLIAAGELMRVRELQNRERVAYYLPTLEPSQTPIPTATLDPRQRFVRAQAVFPGFYPADMPGYTVESALFRTIDELSDVRLGAIVAGRGSFSELFVTLAGGEPPFTVWQAEQSYPNTAALAAINGLSAEPFTHASGVDALATTFNGGTAYVALLDGVQITLWTEARRPDADAHAIALLDALIPPDFAATPLPFVAPADVVRSAPLAFTPLLPAADAGYTVTEATFYIPGESSREVREFYALNPPGDPVYDNAQFRFIALEIRPTERGVRQTVWQSPLTSYEALEQWGGFIPLQQTYVYSTRVAYLRHSEGVDAALIYDDVFMLVHNDIGDLDAALALIGALLPAEARVTPTPSATPEAARTAQLGTQRGTLAFGGGQTWVYEGRAGAALGIEVNADLPASTDAVNGLDTYVRVFSPDGTQLAEADDIVNFENTDTRIDRLQLPVTGAYQIVVSAYGNGSEGGYLLTLTDVSALTPTAATATPTRTPTRTPTVAPTPTPALLGTAEPGTQRGSVPQGGSEAWLLVAQPGDVVSIEVNADLPENDADDPTGTLDTDLRVISPSGQLVFRADDITPGRETDSRIDRLVLREGGKYTLLVGSYEGLSSGGYTLTIKVLSEASTPTPTKAG